MRVSRALWLGVALLLAACAVQRTSQPIRVALLAPFEGRYREIGYNALYAARLALRDTGDVRYALLPVDDGGTLESAAERARALALDPYVVAVIALGYDATAPDAQSAYGDLPVLVVGNWDAQPAGESVFILSHSDLPPAVTTPPRLGVIEASQVKAPLIGGEVFALEQYPALRESLDGVMLVSSGSLPGDDFIRRYRAGEQFAPQPGLLATLTYDATGLALHAIAQTGIPTRSAVAAQIRVTTYSGLNGQISFERGYWQEAPINAFGFDEAGRLRAVDYLIEQR